MPPITSAIDREVLEDLICVEDACRLFQALGKPAEFWETLCLVKAERELLHEEVRRLKELHEAGHAAGVARLVLEKLRAIHEQLDPLMQGLRKFMSVVPGAPMDPEELEFLLGFIGISPKGREAASRWVADPPRQVGEATDRIASIAEVVRTYRTHLRQIRPKPPPLEKAVFERIAPAPPPPAPPVSEPPKTEAQEKAIPAEPQAPAKNEGQEKPVATEPPPLAEKPPESPAPSPPASQAPAAQGAVELPAGVNPDILDDVRRVEQCRKVFEVTHQQIEVWEVFCLVMLDQNTKTTMDHLLQLREGGKTEEFTEGALALFEKLLDMRSKYGRFVRKLREYVAQLPVGHFGKDTMEMALGFIVVSSRGRQLAQQWLDEPDRHKQEACGRLEDVISRTLRYQTALRLTGS
ncbi:MAG: hypothetical protein HYY16_16520 [Planctomycetes bacterium]|nr:hypothetical protein [Planctomycetota bacterium]